jgi:hypothetical protein
MKIWKVTISCLIGVLAVNIAYAQNSEAYKVRLINQKAIELINNRYKWASEIFSQEGLESFRRLLKSKKNSKVANDILPDNNLNEQLNPFAYGREFSNTYDEYSYQSNVSVYYLSPISFQSGKQINGQITLHVKKAIQGVNKKYGTKYTDTLPYQFDIGFKGSTSANGTYRVDRIFIEEISILEPQGKYCFLDINKKFLSKRESMANEQIFVNEHPIKTDSTGRIFLKDVTKPIRLKTHDETIYETKIVGVDSIDEQTDNNTDKNVVKVTFKQPAFFTELRAGLTPSLPVKIESNEFEAKLADGNNFLASAALGFVFHRSEKNRYAVSTGIEYNKIEYSINKSEYNKSFGERPDPDGDRYKPEVAVLDVSEKHSLDILSVPFKANADYNLFNDHYLTAGAGLAYNHLISGNYKSSGKGLYSGTYVKDEFFDVKIAKDDIYKNEFGKSDLSKDESLETAQSFLAWKFNVGWQYKISRRLFIRATANYQTSSAALFEKGDKALSKEKDQINSLTNISNEVYLDQLSFNAGIVINL